jgi:NADH-quinone oxidoreductase subunit C
VGIVPTADGERAVGRIRERFPEAVIGANAMRDQHWVELRAEDLVDVCTWLRDDPENDYDFLVDVTAVHWPEDDLPMELVYHLYSYARNDRLRLKVRSPVDGPVPTLTGLWSAADWNERVVWDMFGIRFDGHPDLRRILMPEDYTDFPLRKEFPLYRG